MQKSSLTKHLFERQIGMGPPRWEVGHADLIHSIDRLRQVHLMHHQSPEEAAHLSQCQRQELAERNYIARVRFNKAGYLLGTSYWSHDSIELWNWQCHWLKQKVPVPTLMGCAVMRFDWLFSHAEAHVVAVGRLGQLKFVDLHQLASFELMGQQPSTSLAYGLHPQLPYNILYGLKAGMVYDFDTRRGPLPCSVHLLDSTDSLTCTTLYKVYSLKVNPANCNEFAVAGCTEDVRLYDRRHADRPLHTMYMTTYPALRTARPGQRPDVAGADFEYITDNRRGRRWNLQDLSYNYNGTQLSLSCGYDSIYLFDTSMRYPIGTFVSNGRRTDDQGMTTSVTSSVIYGIEYFGQKSDFLVAMARGHEHVYPAENCSEFSKSCKRTSLYIWDSFSQELVRRIPMDERNWNFATHPHMPVIATALDQRGIQFWNAL